MCRLLLNKCTAIAFCLNIDEIMGEYNPVSYIFQTKHNFIVSGQFFTLHSTSFTCFKCFWLVSNRLMQFLVSLRVFVNLICARCITTINITVVGTKLPVYISILKIPKTWAFLYLKLSAMKSIVTISTI